MKFSFASGRLPAPALAKRVARHVTLIFATSAVLVSCGWSSEDVQTPESLGPLTIIEQGKESDRGPTTTEKISSSWTQNDLVPSESEFNEAATETLVEASCSAPTPSFVREEVNEAQIVNGGESISGSSFYGIRSNSFGLPAELIEITGGDREVQTPTFVRINDELGVVFTSPGGLGYINPKRGNLEFERALNYRSSLVFVQLNGGIRFSEPRGIVSPTGTTYLVKGADLVGDCTKVALSAIKIQEECISHAVLTLALDDLGAAEVTPAPLWESSPCLSQERVSGAQFGGQLHRINSEEFLVAVGDYGLGPSEWLEFTELEPSDRRPKEMIDGDYGKVLVIDDVGTSVEFTRGHRNMQGLEVDPNAAQILSLEHGPMCGDELNVLVAGGDYGWPKTSVGRPYDSPALSDENPFADGFATFEFGDFTPPLFTLGCDVGPSSLIVVGGDEFSRWGGDILLSSMKRTSIVHLMRNDSEIVGIEYIPAGARVRDLEITANGTIFMVTDNSQLLRWTNAAG